jgi:hypothetical protein
MLRTVAAAALISGAAVDGLKLQSATGVYDSKLMQGAKALASGSLASEGLLDHKSPEYTSTDSSNVWYQVSQISSLLFWPAI